MQADLQGVPEKIHKGWHVINFEPFVLQLQHSRQYMHRTLLLTNP